MAFSQAKVGCKNKINSRFSAILFLLCSFRIELLDKVCRELKILYLQSNLIPRIGKLQYDKIHFTILLVALFINSAFNSQKIQED